MRLFCAALISLLLLACSERPDSQEAKLAPYLQEDLKFMVAQTLSTGHPEALLDTPYYVVDDLRFFDGASAEIYSAYAEVDFFIYKNIKMYEKRKYRYDAHYRQWDRYYKVWMFGSAPE